MPDLDHREMCRFSHKFHDGYGLIVERLTRLRSTLLVLDNDDSEDGDESTTGLSSEAPGHPFVTAPRWPLPAGKHYYEGKELLKKSRLIGRSNEYQNLEEMVTQLLDTDSDYTAVAISGIGGIGKTELLLNLACRHWDQSNIFFLNARDSASLEAAYLFIANDLWSEILANRHSDGDHYRIWQSLPKTERIKLFKRWLGSPENDNTFILFDDIDGLPQASIAEAIPSQARNVLITTRNPGLINALANERDLKFEHLGVTEMGKEDIINFTTEYFNTTLRNNYRDENLQINRTQLQAIAEAASGHPLLAARAVSYILTDLISQYDFEAAIDRFVHTITNGDFAEREGFLLHKLPMQCSIMENFAVSRMRLSDPEGSAWELMKLIAFMSLEDGGFQKFLFHQRPWIGELKDQLRFYNIWSANNQLRGWMNELVQVSMARRRKQTLSFHPVIIQCAQHMIERPEKLQIMRDIFILADESARRCVAISTDPRNMSAMLFFAEALNCEGLCNAWEISREEVDLPNDVCEWLDSDGELNLAHVPTAPPSLEVSETTLKTISVKNKILRILDSCQEAEKGYKNLRQQFSSNQDSSKRGQSILYPLIKALRKIYDRISRLSSDECKRLCDNNAVEHVEEVYRVIIPLAQDPLTHNQMLGE